jgi:hypothetical protein
VVKYFHLSRVPSSKISNIISPGKLHDLKLFETGGT